MTSMVLQGCEVASSVLDSYPVIAGGQPSQSAAEKASSLKSISKAPGSCHQCYH